MSSPGVYKSLLVIEGDNPIQAIIQKIVQAIMSSMGDAAKELTVLIGLIESVIEQVLESIFGPVLKAVEYLGKLILKAADLLNPAKLLAMLKEEIIDPALALVGKLSSLLSKLGNIPGLVAEFAALLLAKLEPKIQLILQQAGMLFSEFLEKLSSIQEFVIAMFTGLISGILKPFVEKILQVITELASGVPAALIAFVTKLAQAAGDIPGIINAIIEFLGLPSPGKLIEMILKPIIEGVETFRKILVKSLDMLESEVNNIQLMISKLIEKIMSILSGNAEMDPMIAQLLSPVFAAVGAIGVVIATLTPMQEITIPIPVFSNLSI